MKIFLYPYSNKSQGARLLAQAMNCRRMSLIKSTIKGGQDTCIINWGNKNSHNVFGNSHHLNHPNYVTLAHSKLSSLIAFNEHGVRTPRFTTDIEEAKSWLLEKDGREVVSRTLLNASGGRGVIIASDPQSIIEAPLYTLYVRKQEEYRVHVFTGCVFDVQRKMRAIAVPDVDWKIRSAANGFIFGREGVDPHIDVLDQAVSAVRALNLDFGAVDVLWQENTRKAYVLEVNTAPGLEGSTITNYANQFTTHVEGLNENVQ